jgi:hypothetical protein
VMRFFWSFVLKMVERSKKRDGAQILRET